MCTFIRSVWYGKNDFKVSKHSPDLRLLSWGFVYYTNLHVIKRNLENGHIPIPGPVICHYLLSPRDTGDTYFVPTLIERSHVQPEQEMDPPRVVQHCAIACITFRVAWVVCLPVNLAWMVCPHTSRQISPMHLLCVATMVKWIIVTSVNFKVFMI